MDAPEKIGMSSARELLSLATEIDGIEAGRSGSRTRWSGAGAALAAALEVARGHGQRPSAVGIGILKAGADRRREHAWTLRCVPRSTISRFCVSRGIIRPRVGRLLDKREPVFIGQ